jgi:hypothetical protein
MAAMTMDQPGYETCHNEPAYSANDIQLTALKRYTTLCVKTSADRISALKIESVSSKSLNFDVTTYAKDGD